MRLTCPWSCAQVNVPCIRAGGCTERCNPSTLSVGCSKTREPTRVTTRTPAVGYNPGWVDPPVTALMPVSQYGRPPLAFRQLGSHCRRQCRQVESLCRHGTASAESLPARHGRAPIPIILPALPAISPRGNLPPAGTHPCSLERLPDMDKKAKSNPCCPYTGIKRHRTLCPLP